MPHFRHKLFVVLDLEALSNIRLHVSVSGLLRKHLLAADPALLEQDAGQAGLLVVRQLNHWCRLLIRFILVPVSGTSITLLDLIALFRRRHSLLGQFLAAIDFRLGQQVGELAV